MRPNTDTLLRTRTNSAGESTRMSFDENSVGFLMDIMTNLYNDPVEAPIREYTSNARDSHIEAGKADVPIEVTLPTEFSKVFRVRDFGMGMSVDDLFNVYSKYGYSTKRDTNSQVGMLGLGSKSGLTYVDQFTVTAIKDGVKTNAIVARGDDGAGTIKILDTSTTDEGNGVTITLPVHNVMIFNRKVNNILRWWSPGTVLVDGREPEGVSGDKLEITDDITLFKNGLGRDYVIMGEVAYQVETRLSGGLPHGYHIVARVPMGAVNFPPNREGLQYTERTERVLKDIVQRRDNAIKSAAERDVRQAKTHTEAILISSTWSGLLPRGIGYKGKEIPYVIKKSEDSIGFFYYNFSRYRNNLSRQRHVQAIQFAKCVIVKNFTNKNLSVSNRRKIKLYLEQQDIDAEAYIASDEVVGESWADGLTVLDWNDIKTLRLSSNKGALRHRTAPEQFDVYDTAKQEAKIVDKKGLGKNLIMVSPAILNTRNRDHITKKAIGGVFKDHMLVILSKNRFEKFQREHPKAVSFSDALKNKFEAIDKGLNRYERVVLSHSFSSEIELFGHLDASQIDDPKISSLVKEAKGYDPTKRDTVNRIRRMGRLVNYYPRIECDDNPYEEVLDKYPYLRYSYLGNPSRNGVPEEHVYEYLNTFYEKENK